MPGMPACADKVSGSGCKRVGAEAQPTSVMATMAAATLRLKSGNNRILHLLHSGSRIGRHIDGDIRHGFVYGGVSGIACPGSVAEDA